MNYPPKILRIQEKTNRMRSLANPRSAKNLPSLANRLPVLTGLFPCVDIFQENKGLALNAHGKEATRLQTQDLAHCILKNLLKWSNLDSGCLVASFLSSTSYSFMEPTPRAQTLPHPGLCECPGHWHQRGSLSSKRQLSEKREVFHSSLVPWGHAFNAAAARGLLVRSIDGELRRRPWERMGTFPERFSP